MAKKAEAVSDEIAGKQVVSVVSEGGVRFYAWRKDGVRPVIDEAAFARNIHSALDGNPGADFADRVGPQ